MIFQQRKRSVFQVILPQLFKLGTNPHLLKREDQLKNDYVWFAVYDEDMVNDTFLKKLV